MTTNGHQPRAPLDLAPARDELDRLLDRAGDRAFELEFIKQTRSYRLASAWRRSALGRLVASTKGDVVRIRALGRAGAQSKGAEVWLLHASTVAGGRSVPWDFVVAGEGWTHHPEPSRPHGKCLRAEAAADLVVRLAPDPELRFLRHPWSGMVEVSYRGRRETIDLYAPESGVVRVFPARTPMVVAAPIEAPAPQPAATPASDPPRAFTPDEAAFIERIRRANPPVVAVSCPTYFGVTASTVNLFEHTYFMPGRRGDDPRALTEDDLQHHARVLAATGCDRVLFSGGDDKQHRVMDILRGLRPGVRCDLFLHASYPQFCEDLTWAWVKQWFDSARVGHVHTIASDKFGYDRFVASLGLRGAVLLNRVPGEPGPVPDLPESPRRIGFWPSGETYRKIPHAMLAAVRMMPDAVLHGSGLAGRAREVVEYFRIPTGEVSERALPHDELFPAMRRTHLTLYVTFIECCPMLPLESLHQGVPALLGPNSHLFEDCPFLFERLVMRFPERAEVIADYAERAIRERREIIEAYRAYWPTYDAKARASVEAFLSA